MSFGENLLKIGRIISKEWRPYCWFNKDYDKNKPCDQSLGEPESWCCEQCQFRPRKKTNKG